MGCWGLQAGWLSLSPVSIIPTHKKQIQFFGVREGGGVSVDAGKPPQPMLLSPIKAVVINQPINDDNFRPVQSIRLIVACTCTSTSLIILLYSNTVWAREWVYTIQLQENQVVIVVVHTSYISCIYRPIYHRLNNNYYSLSMMYVHLRKCQQNN